MKNNKGQALIEFVLILPVLLAILLIIVDFGKIFNAKSTLENTSMDVIEMYKKGIILDEIKLEYKDITINVISKDKYETIKLSRKVDLLTPGLNIFIEDPYPIVVERTIPNEVK